MNGAAQEMTLDEWVDRLPESHTARKALARLRAQVDKLTEENKQLTTTIQMLGEDQAAMCEDLNKLIDEHGGWVEDADGTYASNFRRIIATLTRHTPKEPTPPQ